MKSRFKAITETLTALTLINYQDLPTTYALEDSGEIPWTRDSLICSDKNMVFRFALRSMR
jgi:hypothetical protein